MPPPPPPPRPYASRHHHHYEARGGSPSAAAAIPIGRVLVSFAHHDARSSAPENLAYFLTVGVAPYAPSPDVTYGIVINDYRCSVALPNRSDLFVVRRENTGFDHGQHLAMLQHLAAREQRLRLAGFFDRVKARLFARSRVDTAAFDATKENGPRLLNVLPYTHYFFMNGGVRGPFLPVYWPRHLHWSRAYFDQIDATVKLVGSSIVCLQHPDGCVRRDPSCAGPKIEGYTWATDRAGLRTILAHEPKVFAQHVSKTKAVVNGEYGMNRAILAANYSMTTLLLAYRGVDWRNADFTNDAAACNQFEHPSREGSYFGLSVHPLETVFMKTDWAGAPVREAETKAYTRWELHGPS